MMGKSPSAGDIENLLHATDIHHDLYIIGSQEACNSIAKSVFLPSKQKIVDLCRD